MSDDVRCLAVLGAGTMGHGIAQIAAKAGYQTTLYDVNMSVVEQGLTRIKENLAKAVELGKATEQECADTLALIHLSSDLGRAERAVLRATDETLDDGAISPATFRECEVVLPGREELLELIAAIGNWNLFSQLLRSLEIPLEDGVEAWPPDGAVPKRGS